jgi:hypothetical protein
MDVDQPLQGPVFRVPCNGMHFDPADPHQWIVDDELVEFCNS